MSKIFILFFSLFLALWLNVGAHVSNSYVETSGVECEQYMQEMVFSVNFELLSVDENEDERVDTYGFWILHPKNIHNGNSDLPKTSLLPRCIIQGPVPLFYTNLPPPLSA